MTTTMTFGKMGVGAKLINDWKNPYITDGLILHWDYFWNVGGGVFYPSASTWKDLSGNGLDANNVDPTKWANGYYHVVNSNVWAESELIRNAITSNNITFEVGLVKTSTTVISDRYSIFGTSDEDPAHRDFRYHPKVYSVSNSTYGSVPGWFVWRGIYRLNVSSFLNTTVIGTKQIMSITAKDETSTAYKNGTQIATDSNGTGTNASTPRFKLGGLGSEGGSDCDLGYLFARVYSRALTVDEIAANHNIDKLRFNLPQ